ncbi:MAG: glycoside hydrolase family 2 [Bacteroidaceae bacterium]|nr:glycoside hydrolase family 2 [Bacteroidaceae bacterium]
MLAVLCSFCLSAEARPLNHYRPEGYIYLDTQVGQQWLMKRASDEQAPAEQLSATGFFATDWQRAIVPGTVLNSLVANGVYPEPYFGLNNKLSEGIIPDLATAGRNFYTYWFRTEFNLPDSFRNKIVWLNVEGINYRAEVWLNGQLVTVMSGMFRPAVINVTEWVQRGVKNVLAVKVFPVDVPGTSRKKDWGAAAEWRNGGDGQIGKNVTMLMSAGWDFTFDDGIRDRNTGIWRSISLFATSSVRLASPFVVSNLNATYDRAEETVSVEVNNATTVDIKCEVEGEIRSLSDTHNTLPITFTQHLNLFRGETRMVTFSPDNFRQLVIEHPHLWWPIGKGPQNLYELRLRVKTSGAVSDSLTTRFGIREVRSDQQTPDGSRQFYVNGHPFFVIGTNWIPEAMLRSSDDRTYAELRYTQQSGINFIRMWGGGIAESDYFFQLCDEMGLLVWQEFWMTGDTHHPTDADLYLANVEATVKRLRNHPSLAYYVSSNESTEMPGARLLINQLDPTRGYQMQSECDGIHDGSPYKQVNPMCHYENTASERGSRIDGFNPEYGAPTLPIAESLREMMHEHDLWPINKEVWDYHDGGGFHLMSTMFTDLTNAYGPSASIDEFAQKAQLVGAINSKSIWESWNRQKLNYGERYCAGLLFWYHNCPVQQVCARMWDYSLEPTASLYHTQNALEPLHPQFDYLRNTVSVVNSRYEVANNLRLIAEVYTLSSKLVWKKEASIDVPADGVAVDVFAIDFPEDITQVHFIKLRLFDANGQLVGDNFYWRSRDHYEGRTTLTGPCTSGFETLADMPKAKVAVRLRKMQDGLMQAEIRNTGNTIAFFLQMQLRDSEGRSIKPCFLSDNFLTLMPDERRTIKIDDTAALNRTSILVLKGWNVTDTQIRIN